MRTLGSLVTLVFGGVTLLFAVTIHYGVVRESDGNTGFSLAGAAVAGAATGLGIVAGLRLFQLRATGAMHAFAAAFGFVGFVWFSYLIYDTTYVTTDMRTNLTGEGAPIREFVRRDTGEPITYWYYLTHLVEYPWLAIPVGLLGYTLASAGVVVGLAAEKPYCRNCHRYMTAQTLFSLPFDVFAANRRLLAESVQSAAGLRAFSDSANRERPDKNQPHVRVELVSCRKCSQGTLIVRSMGKHGRDQFEESSMQEIAVHPEIVREFLPPGLGTVFRHDAR